MKNFAAIQSGKVFNILIADTKEIAEQLTGKTCVEYNPEVDTPCIGEPYKNGIFYPTCPFKGFVFNEQTKNWQPPRPIPNTTDPYDWDEDIEDWKLISE